MRGCEKIIGQFLEINRALSKKIEVVEFATSHLQCKILIAHKPDPLSTNEK